MYKSRPYRKTIIFPSFWALPSFLYHACFNRFFFFSPSHLAEWSAHNNAIFDLKWTDTEPWVLTASGDQTAALWDVSRGCRLAVFKQHSSSLKSVSFRPGDRNVFATGARDGKIMVWDIRCNHKGNLNLDLMCRTIIDSIAALELGFLVRARQF